MENDYRVQYLLKQGDIIMTAADEYIIQGLLGLGGTSVVYSAKRANRERPFAIKEWFPAARGQIFVRSKTDGVILPAGFQKGRDEDLMAEYKKDYIEELANGDNIYRVTDMVAPISELITPIQLVIGGKHVAGDSTSLGIFAVMDSMTEKGMTFRQLLNEIALPKDKVHPLRTGGMPSVFTTCRIMEKILTAVQAVHEKANHVVADISVGNIFFVDVTQHDIGTVKLLDLACAKKLDANEKNVLIDGKLYTTPGFTPPEFIDPLINNGMFQMDAKSDIFSLGCVMLRCLFPEENLAYLGDSPYIREKTLMSTDQNRLGINRDIANQINQILFKAMQQNPDDRPSVNEMLEHISELKKMVEPSKYLLPKNSSSPDYYDPRSRDQEINIIKESLKTNDTVFLWGMGGIGKSEVAIHFSREKGLEQYRGVYFIHYQNTMEETILNMEFSGYHDHFVNENMSEDEKKREQIKNRLEIIRDYYHDTILIIDDFFVPDKTFDDLRKEPAYHKLISEIGGNQNIKFIFTTRYPQVSHPEWEIKELSCEYLLGMMRFYYKNEKVPDEQLLELIKEVNGHTLTLTLIAKTLQESGFKLTPKRIIRALRTGSLNNKEYPNISSDKDRTYDVGRIHNHLAKLIKISPLGESARTVLSYAALIPGHRTKGKVFEAALTTKERRELTQLIKLGWLIRSNENEIIIHPVIAEICKEETSPRERIFVLFGIRLIFPLTLFVLIMTLLREILPLEDPVYGRILPGVLVLLCFGTSYLYETAVEKICNTGHRKMGYYLAFSCFPLFYLTSLLLIRSKRDILISMGMSPNIGRKIMEIPVNEIVLDVVIFALCGLVIIIIKDKNK